MQTGDADAILTYDVHLPQTDEAPAPQTEETAPPVYILAILDEESRADLRAARELLAQLSQKYQEGLGHLQRLQAHYQLIQGGQTQVWQQIVERYQLPPDVEYDYASGAAFTRRPPTPEPSIANVPNGSSEPQTTNSPNGTSEPPPNRAARRRRRH